MLIAEDFDVEMLSKEQLTRMRDEVESEVQSVVGWTGNAQGDTFAPKQLLQRVQATMLQLERESGGAASQGMSWNMWITGKSGCGKTKFAMLLKRYLRAYGAVDKDVLVVRTASQLMDSCACLCAENVKQAFAEAASMPGSHT